MPGKPAIQPLNSDLGSYVSQMSDDELQEALNTYQPTKIDKLIPRLDPKPRPGGADMVRGGDQGLWKWDGNQVRYLTDEEKQAEAQRERAAMLRERARLERMQNMRRAMRRPQ